MVCIPLWQHSVDGSTDCPALWKRSFERQEGPFLHLSHLGSPFYQFFSLFEVFQVYVMFALTLHVYSVLVAWFQCNFCMTIPP